MAYLLIADGRTDRALVPILDWAVRQIDADVDVLEPAFEKHAVPLRALEVDDIHQLVFIHRDAEGAGMEQRAREFEELRQRVVPVIPVRMTETWLLTDAGAIAAAAGRPDRVVAAIPRLTQLEGLADPKQVLEGLLREAADAGAATGRKRKQFEGSLAQRRVDVALRTREFGRLRALSTFRRFSSHLEQQYPFAGRPP